MTPRDLLRAGLVRSPLLPLLSLAVVLSRRRRSTDWSPGAAPTARPASWSLPISRTTRVGTLLSYRVSLFSTARHT
jgi:hypothetical protein